MQRHRSIYVIRYIVLLIAKRVCEHEYHTFYAIDIGHV
jgi:hypothetical protein